MKIRAVEKKDLSHLKEVIDRSELFPSEMLDEMISGYFLGEEESIWLTGDEDTPSFVAYCAPERMTNQTWNLYLIAVHDSLQGQGIGARVMTYLEDLLKEKGVRILIVETSDLPEFERTRAFYDKCNYTREALIREFYDEGEGKVVFWKKLSV